MSELALPDKQYFKIGEVARIIGVKTSVLRFWETEFHTIRPKKTRSGHRLYTRRHVERIASVKNLLYQDKYTIAGARKRLRQLSAEEKAGVPARSPASTQKQRSQLRSDLRKELRDLLKLVG